MTHQKLNLFLCSSIALLSCLPGFAQSLREIELPRRQGEQVAAQQSPRLGRLNANAQALEAAIDPKTYIVGPGDVFHVELEGMNEYTVTTAVSPEGKLILPTLGTYQVDGKTLATIREQVAAKARSKYIGGKINLNLLDVRRIRVHLTGQVQNPGTYEARAVYRVSDVIAMAGGLSPWANARAIELQRKDQPPKQIDYYSFLAQGKLDENVLVQGGDIIYVPSVYESPATVQLEGRVQNKGLYAIREGETAEEFLFHINALENNADLRQAIVLRRTELTGETQALPLFPSETGNGKSVVLQPNDIIRVPGILDSVYVQGDCRAPGSYPFQPGRRARDYAGLAGPSDTAVSPSGLKVVRAESNQVLKGADVLIERGDTILIPSNTRKKVGDIFSIVAQIASITYFVVIIREQLQR